MKGFVKRFLSKDCIGILGTKNSLGSGDMAQKKIEGR